MSLRSLDQEMDEYSRGRNTLDEKSIDQYEKFQSIINKLKKAEQNLQDATFRYIVNYLATKEEKAELLKTF